MDIIGLTIEGHNTNLITYWKNYVDKFIYPIEIIPEKICR